MNNKKDLQIFCENIKTIREKTKLSQEEMAKKLGISRYSLSKIERGEIPPKLSCEILFTIHDEFGIAPSEMFCPRSFV